MGESESHTEHFPTLHIVTPEFPPASGGVAGHTSLLANGLRARGFPVVTWCSKGTYCSEEVERGWLRPELGNFNYSNLVRVGRILLQEGGCLLLQWVPQAFGMRGFNISFVAWIWYLSRKRLPVYVLFHELYNSFGVGLKSDIRAMLYRLMTLTLCRASTAVWASSGHYCRILRTTFSCGSKVEILPSGSNIKLHVDPEKVSLIRSSFLDSCNSTERIIGHFSLYGSAVSRQLVDCMVCLHQAEPGLQFLLLGVGSRDFVDRISRTHPSLASRCHFKGFLCPESVSHHLQSCDLLLQPCPDGLNTRHTGVMAGLCNRVPVATFTNWRTERFWFEDRSLLLVRDGDTDQMCRGILRLLTFKQTLSDMGVAGRILYLNKFDEDKLIDRIAGRLLL